MNKYVFSFVSFFECELYQEIIFAKSKLEALKIGLSHHPEIQEYDPEDIEDLKRYCEEYDCAINVIEVELCGGSKNDNTNYIISKKELEQLLRAELILDQLEYEGVDNWEGCGCKEHEFYSDVAKELGISYNPEDNIINRIIKAELEEYQKI